MASSGSSTFFVLVEFLNSEHKKKGFHCSVVPSSSLKYCPTLEDAGDNIINTIVKVRHELKGKPTELYQAKVLAHSVSRPDLVALMSTYIKTGQLTTPSSGKRPRIPRTLDSSSSGSDSSESGLANLPDKVKKTKKLQKAYKVSASLKAARSILNSYDDQQKDKVSSEDVENYSDNSLDDNVEARLKSKINEQAETIKKLKAKLRAATQERDAMIETHERNKQMAQELRKSLKYARQLASGSSTPTSLPSTRPNSASSISLPDLSISAHANMEHTQPGLDHDHLRHKSSDPGVVQLGKSSIFVNGINLTTVISTSTSCTMLCRNLLELVFTAEALARCSARGRKSNGLGKGAAEAREPLYQIAINAIIDFTISQGKANHWKIQDQSACVAAMGKRLNEIRNVLKLSAGAVNTNEDDD